MNCSILLLRLQVVDDLRGTVDALGDGLDLVLDRRRRPRRGSGTRSAARTRRPPPRPARRRPCRPAAKPSLTAAAKAPPSLASRVTSSTSSSVSSGRRLTATTAGQPELAHDPEVAVEVRDPGLDRRQSVASLLAPGLSSSPPWCFSARTVATRTIALGTMPPARQTMSMNFSIPMSEPKPDSVITYSPSFRPEQVGDQGGVAVGDVGERAGVHQAGLALQRLDQVRLDRVLEQHRHRPGRAEVLGGHRLAVARVGGGDPARAAARRSWRSRATARTAITSEAAVMSNPLSRG